VPTSDRRAILEIHNVEKHFGRLKALDGVSFDIYDGEKMVIIGPSGSGKSTLLRLLQFLEEPTQGSITFDGLALKRPVELAVRRRVATVFQRPLLLDRSVRDNVAFGLRLRGWRELGTRVVAALDRVGLTELADARARTLSGGEAQRVALARATVIEPDALLLDEPTANLDPYNVSLIENLIREHDRTTIVLVTHNVFQARRLADRVGLLLNGRLIELAPTDRFFNAPQDPRTHAFINGEMVY
jgi:tungstate transport system ATP-binding protein